MSSSGEHHPGWMDVRWWRRRWCAAALSCRLISRKSQFRALKGIPSLPLANRWLSRQTNVLALGYLTIAHCFRTSHPSAAAICSGYATDDWLPAPHPYLTQTHLAQSPPPSFTQSTSSKHNMLLLTTKFYYVFLWWIVNVTPLVNLCCVGVFGALPRAFRARFQLWGSIGHCSFGVQCFEFYFHVVDQLFKLLRFYWHIVERMGDSWWDVFISVVKQDQTTWFGNGCRGGMKWAIAVRGMSMICENERKLL